MEADFVIVGGGIAGVSCAENLAFLQPDKTIILLSESALIKTVTNLHAITKTIMSFDVEETLGSSLSDKYSNIKIVYEKMSKVNDSDFCITTESGLNIKYAYLCLCMGAQPKLIPQSQQFPEFIIGIRDTDSVECFVEKLKGSKKIVVVGNGGIASEVVYKLSNIQVDWVVKDNHISATFVDPGAAEFFQDSLKKGQEQPSETISKRMRYREENAPHSGAALGPDWYKNLVISGANSVNTQRKVNIHYECEIASVTKSSNTLEVILTNGQKVACDLIVSATGVMPRSHIQTSNPLDIADDGGIKVNEYMQTNLNRIYAAGDICTANWSFAKHWFQMKLWTQARQMGCYAAKCMAGVANNEEVLQDFCFEIFTHSTKLFGFKVILLGLFNGQKLDNNYEVLLRTTKGMEYVKFVIEDHKLQGAILIGDTDLEEMCENLILNQINLEPYGDDILNPDIDIEDYFD